MDILLGMALSAHLGFEKTYNQTHPHLRLESEHVVSGVYYNSSENVSFYVGSKFDFSRYYIEGGMVTGYGMITGYDFLNGIIPYARVGVNITDNISAFIAPAGETIHGEVHVHPVIGIEFFNR